jgi:hypothetical protein
MLGNIFGPEREEVIGEWRKIRNKEFYNVLYATMYSYGYHVKDDVMCRMCVCVWDKRHAYRFLSGKHLEDDQLKDVGVEGRVILKGILRQYDWRTWTGFV